jgi:hypothetical protein
VFAATVDEIYEMDTAYDWGAGLSASLAVPDGNDLSMRQFGVYMIITNTVDGMFSYNMETPAGFSAVKGSPDARIIFPTNNLLVALDCDANNRRLQTSDFGRFDDWSTGAALGKDLEDGEALTGGSDLGGGRAIVTQQNAVRVMTFGQAGGGEAGRHQPAHALERDVADRGAVGAGEAAAAQRLRRQGVHEFGRREALARVKRDEAAQHRLGGAKTGRGFGQANLGVAKLLGRPGGAQRGDPAVGHAPGDGRRERVPRVRPGRRRAPPCG